MSCSRWSALLGSGAGWEGNVACADGHVFFTKDPAPETIKVEYEISACGDRPLQSISYADNLFYDEPWEGRDALHLDVTHRRNAYLRQWFNGVPIGDGLADAHFREGRGGFVYIEGDPIE